MIRRPLVLPLILSACAGQPIDAPSLLPRPIETRSEAVAARSETVLPDPTLDARIADRVTAFDAAAKAFDAAYPAAAKRAAGRTASEGSERWLDAQAAIGEVQQLRTAVDAAMADLEALAIERAGAGALAYPALDTAIAAAQATVDRQTRQDAALR